MHRGEGVGVRGEGCPRRGVRVERSLRRQRVRCTRRDRGWTASRGRGGTAEIVDYARRLGRGGRLDPNHPTVYGEARTIRGMIPWFDWCRERSDRFGQRALSSRIMVRKR